MKRKKERRRRLVVIVFFETKHLKKVTIVAITSFVTTPIEEEKGNGSNLLPSPFLFEEKRKKNGQW